MAKKSKKKSLISFNNIFKTTFYFKISDTIFAFIICVFALLSGLGYFLKKRGIELENKRINSKNSNNSKKKYKNLALKYLGTSMMIIFGICTIILLLPVIINFVAFFFVDYGLNEAFSE